MKIPDLIAQHLIEVHEGNNWTEVDLAHTVGDLSYTEAFTLTKASSNMKDPILPGYPSIFKSLLGMVEHAHYHLGQITIIRNLLRT
jgi:hypothetical protein